MGENGLYSVCSYVLRMVLRKYRGRTRLRIGSIWESIDPNELRRQIREYDTLNSNVPIDDVEEPDSWFTREGI